MLLEIIFFLFLGILFGIFTGLVPGLHINLIGAVLVSLSATVFYEMNGIYLVVFIVSMAISHVFLDFIPSIFLGAPEDGTELSVLPGHEMLKNGLGFQAICLTSLGGILGIFLFLVSLLPLIWLSPMINSFTGKIIPFILIIASFGLVLAEKKKINALLAFAISGILGLIVLNLDFKEPLTPLLTGMFGASSILLSLESNSKIEKQNTEEIVKVKKFKPLLASLIVSPLSIFLPALSSGQLAAMGNQISKSEKGEFLFMLGAINVLAMSFSFLALFILSKTRTGSAFAVKEILGSVDARIFALIVAAIVLSGIISFFVSRFIAKKFAVIIEKINYKKVSISVLLIMIAIVFAVSGIVGIAVLIASTLAGIYCISLGVSRTQMMGCLILPTIFLYIF